MTLQTEAAELRRELADATRAMAAKREACLHASRDYITWLKAESVRTRAVIDSAWARMGATGNLPAAAAAAPGNR